jgi:hypothetical protein
MNIAVLVLVHKNVNQAERLIHHLSKDFSLYVHVDKKSPITLDETGGARIYKVFKTYWGSFNIVKATLFLLREAYKNNHDRYVLISGQDLPITTNAKIQEFFERNGKDYIEVMKLPYKFGNCDSDLSRVLRYWPSIKVRWKYRKSIVSESIYLVKEFLLNCTMNLKKRPLDYEFYGGAQWFNLTRDTVGTMLRYLEHTPAYIKRYYLTHISDEIFFQTLIKLLNIEAVNSHLRYIDWETGDDYPRIFTKEDFDRVIRSGALFARKFDEGTDTEIIDMIYTYITEEASAEASAEAGSKGEARVFHPVKDRIHRNAQRVINGKKKYEGQAEKESVP